MLHNNHIKFVPFYLILLLILILYLKHKKERINEMPKLEREKYVKSIGTIIINLHALEFLLRSFLLKYNENNEPKVDIDNLKINDIVEENSFTNWDALRELIKKYNRIAIDNNSDFLIDENVSAIRDMLAHGRISSTQPDIKPILLKFSKPNNRKIKVNNIVELNERWLEESVKLIFDQCMKILDLSKTFEYSLGEFHPFKN